MTETSLSYAERRDWLRLSRSENVGPQTFQALLDTYGDASQALEALPALSAKGGLRRTISIYAQDRAESDIERAEALDARFVAICETDYPPLLRQVDGAPPVICVKGDVSVLQPPAIAIVGARNASALGRKLTRRLAGELCDAGFCVVSGMARGIDTAAHQGSVEHATVAVLAGGIDNIYPPENEELYHTIARQGLLVSEHVVGTKPQAQHFPRRNRLVSGMSLGVLVVEAAMRSGSLITSRLALEQNREVFAVPGSPLDPRAEGTNSLIKKGATLVRTVDDILDVLSPIIGNESEQAGARLADTPPSEPDGAQTPVSHSERGHLLQLVGTAAIDIDDVIRESGMDASAVMTALLELELAGTIERLPQQKVIRTAD